MQNLEVSGAVRHIYIYMSLGGYSLKPEDDPNAGSKHVAYLTLPYIIKGSCARRTNFLPFIHKIIYIVFEINTLCLFLYET